MHFQEIGGPNSTHGGYLHWISNPANPQRLPYRTRIQTNLMLRQKELAQFTPTASYHTRTFYLDKEDDRLYYEEVMQRVLLGWYRKTDRERLIDPVTKQVTVYLEWAQVYIDVPSNHSIMDLEPPSLD